MSEIQDRINRCVEDLENIGLVGMLADLRAKHGVVASYYVLQMMSAGLEKILLDNGSCSAEEVGQIKARAAVDYYANFETTGKDNGLA